MSDELSNIRVNSSSMSHDHMKVRMMRTLDDNFMYLVICTHSKQAAVIDPITPELIVKAAHEEDCHLTKILTTHHHWDHAGGNEQLKKLWKRNILEVYGGNEMVEGITHQVKHGDKFHIGKILGRCLIAPGHTRDDVCYFLSASEGVPCIFTGDCLFTAGCGTKEEGTVDQFFTSLHKKMRNLPSSTLVYGGHENTIQNLKFALHVEPENTDIQKMLGWAMVKSSKGEPTVPSSISIEKRVNPFLRLNSKSIQKHCNAHTPIKALQTLLMERSTFSG